MMKLFLLMLITFNVNCDQSEVIGKMKEEAKNIKADYPLNYNVYITNLNAGSIRKMNTIHKNELESLSKQLPPEIYQKFKGILYSQSTSMEVYSFVANQNSASIRVYLGTAVKEDEFIRYSYIDTFSMGSIVPRYDRIEKQNCYRWWIFWRKCDKYFEYFIHQNNQSELNIIETALKAHAYNNLMKKIDSLTLDVQFELDNENKINSYSNTYNLLLDPNKGILKIKTPEGEIPLKNGVTNTSINPADGPFTLQLKTSGNMQIQGKTKKVWQTGTGFMGEEPYRIVLTEDPDLLIVDLNWKPLWDSQGLYDDYDVALIEHNILYSKNNQFYVIVQKDGNLVLYTRGKNGEGDIPIWCSGLTEGSVGPYSLVVDKFGTMQVKGKGHSNVWTAKLLKQGIPPFKISVADNGEFKLKDRRDVTIWTSAKAPLKDD